MNAPYPPYLIQADDKIYPYNDETLAAIHVVENTRMGLPPDTIWKLEPDGLGFRYSICDPVEFVDQVKAVEVPVRTIEGIAA